MCVCNFENRRSQLSPFVLKFWNIRTFVPVPDEELAVIRLGNTPHRYSASVPAHVRSTSGKYRIEFSVRKGYSIANASVVEECTIGHMDVIVQCAKGFKQRDNSEGCVPECDESTEIVTGSGCLRPKAAAAIESKDLTVCRLDC